MKNHKILLLIGIIICSVYCVNIYNNYHNTIIIKDQMDKKIIKIKTNEKWKIVKYDKFITYEQIKKVYDVIQYNKITNIPKINKILKNNDMYGYEYNYVDGVVCDYGHHNIPINILKAEWNKLLDTIIIFSDNKIMTLEIKPQNLVITENYKFYIIDVIEVEYDGVSHTTKLANLQEHIMRTFLGLIFKCDKNTLHKIRNLIKNNNKNILDKSYINHNLQKLFTNSKKVCEWIEIRNWINSFNGYLYYSHNII